MGRYIFRLPDIGEGVAEAEIVAWHVAPGQTIAEDQSLVDVMTDKATVDMTSPVDGKVIAIHGAIGEMLAVGSPLVELEVAGDGNVGPGVGPDVSPGVGPDSATPATPPAAAPAPARAPAPAPVAEPASPRGAPAAATAAQPAQPAPAPQLAPAAPGATPPRNPATPPSGATGGAVFASPATRRRAFDLGIPLQFVPGTGPAGRITSEDLDAYLASGATPPPQETRLAPRDGVEEERIIGLRRKIAEKMQEAKRRIPHITYVEEIDVTELEALRQDLNANRTPDQPKLTMLPLLMRAMVRVLPEFPQINARYDDDAGVLHRHAGVHIGIATQTPGGLMVPVVAHAEARDIWALASEVARVAQAARDGTARREELSGSTITITSLGPLGGITTTPVINHPEVAIIGPNKIVERPVVQGSFITVRKLMNLSSAFDHRIVDGYDAALFVQRLKRLLEHPALIFMD